MAAKYVVHENSRPKIIHSLEEMEELSDDDEEALLLEPTQDKGNNFKSNKETSLFDVHKSVIDDKSQTQAAKHAHLTFCDKTISRIIRECWSHEPEERPNFYEICLLLNKKIQAL